jgi:hypothetical protein
MRNKGDAYIIIVTTKYNNIVLVSNNKAIGSPNMIDVIIPPPNPRT